MNDPLIVLYAHGSRDAEWRATFTGHLAMLQSELGAERVALAYMEMAEPSLLDVVGAGVSRGVTTFKVLPVFFSRGGHVSKDLPRLVDEAQKKFPTASLELLAPIGEHSSFSDFLLKIVCGLV